MTWPNAIPAVEAVLEERGIRDYSIIGGKRVKDIALQAIDRYRGVVDEEAANTHRIYRFDAQDWSLEFDEENGEEAWWIEIQVDAGNGGATPDFILSLSDVEAHQLIDALLEKIATGRERYS